jgi:hypothetical protein
MVSNEHESENAWAGRFLSSLDWGAIRRVESVPDIAGGREFQRGAIKRDPTTRWSCIVRSAIIYCSELLSSADYIFIALSSFYEVFVYIGHNA